MISRVPWKLVVYILLAGYVGFVAMCMRQSISQIDFIYAQPQKVNFAARELKGWLGTSAAQMPALLSNNALSPQAILELFTVVWDEEDLRLEDIIGSFRGDPRLVVALKRSIRDLRLACGRAAANAGGKIGYMEAKEYFDEHVAPLFLDTNSCVANIIDESFNLSSKTQADIRRLMESTVYASIIFALLLLGGSFLISRQAASKNRQIANSERMFSILSQNLEEVFIIADSRGAFHYVSPGCGRVTGYGVAKILKNPGCFYDFLPPEAREWLKTVLSGAAIEEKKFAFDKNGRFFTLQVYGVEDAQTDGSHVIVLADDTERARNERHLRDALENARVANSAKSMFISRMTRELSDPINAISGLSSAALHRLDDRAAVEEGLREIAVYASHVLFIINDVRDISSMASGTLVLNNSVFNVAAFTRDLASKALPYAEGRDQTLEVVTEDDTNVDVTGDSARLRQILVNLLSNAIKYTPPEGGIVLRAACLPDVENRPRFRFVVGDSGRGMSPELLEKIFVPFERGDNGPEPKNGDVGLGMPVTYNLVTLMGGVISVKSAPGEGTEVTVDIPFDLAQKTEKDNG